jgi:hypothetical protein
VKSPRVNLTFRTIVQWDLYLEFSRVSNWQKIVKEHLQWESLENISMKPSRKNSRKLLHTLLRTLKLLL